MINTKAKYKGKDVTVSYVNSDVSWALISYENSNGKFKVECSMLDDVNKIDMINISNKYLYEEKEDN
jgi:hypothetical protein